VDDLFCRGPELSPHSPALAFSGNARERRNRSVSAIQNVFGSFPHLLTDVVQGRHQLTQDTTVVESGQDGKCPTAHGLVRVTG
jgi:hypothetical protein